MRPLKPAFEICPNLADLFLGQWITWVKFSINLQPIKNGPKRDRSQEGSAHEMEYSVSKGYVYYRSSLVCQIRST